jgi:hypothetical protein
MRFFRKTMFVLTTISGLVLLAGSGIAAELKAEGTEPGISILIQDLKRDESNSVTLRFQVINDSAKSFHPGCKWREASNRACDEIGAVHLIDNANKKKYLVVRDSAGKCTCSLMREVKAGARTNLWAKFAAPPANVEKVTVVVPDFQPIDGVPITQ